MRQREKKYSGVVIPMISPFCDDLSVDTDAAKILCQKIVDDGTVPFVLGSTGEGVSMTLEQKVALIKACSCITSGKTLLYAGISGNSLQTSIDETLHFAAAGANVAVATLPFYFPIDNDQMLKYFNCLADKSALPLILYNMPGMVKKSIPIEVVEKICQHPNIVGLKDSERDANRHETLIAKFKNQDDFSFLVGWAASSVNGLLAGADGIVPSTGNICPGLYRELYDEVLAGNSDKAKSVQEKTNQISALYQTRRDLSYSIPALKVMMHIKGWCKPNVLPPMFRLSESEENEYIAYVRTEMEKLKI